MTDGRLASDRLWLGDALVEALQLMAAPYPEQVAALPGFVVVPDEVALVFDDAYGVLDPAELPPSVSAQLEFLDKALEEMSSDPDGKVWSLQGLEHGVEWQNIRMRASEVLRTLGIPLSAPSIRGSDYVEGRRTDP